MQKRALAPLAGPQCSVSAEAMHGALRISCPAKGMKGERDRMSEATSSARPRGACGCTAAMVETASILVVLLLSYAVRAPICAQALPLASGDRIRVELAERLFATASLTSPWEGTFMMQRGDTLLARSTYGSDAVSLPLSDVRAVYARRERGPGHALLRGAIGGTIFGVVGWQFMNVLCRSACKDGLDNAWLPAAGAGLLFAVLVVGQGPGQHWIRVDGPRETLGSGR